MKLTFLVMFICLITFRANGQEANSTDSLQISGSDYNFEAPIISRMRAFDSDSFQFSSFSLKFNLPITQFNFQDKNLLHYSLYLSSGFQDNMLDNNKLKMFNSFYNLYVQSRPSTMQKMLGMMQLSGVAFLAGYHIYKYSIKKKD